MKPVRTSNKDCRQLVKDMREFDAHQLYARWEKPNVYVVYSYGPHWPLFACINGQWYDNTERTSASTARQRSQAHPHCDMIETDRDGLAQVIKNNYHRAAA